MAGGVVDAGAYIRIPLVKLSGNLPGIKKGPM